MLPQNLVEMATTLLNHINYVNQAIANKFYPMCVQWNRKKGSWVYAYTKTSSHSQKHKFAVAAYVILYIVGLLNALVVSLHMPNAFQIQDIFMVALVGVTMTPILLLMDFVMTKFGHDIIATTNWGIKKQLKMNLRANFRQPANLVKAFVAGNI